MIPCPSIISMALLSRILTVAHMNLISFGASRTQPDMDQGRTTRLYLMMFSLGLVESMENLGSLYQHFQSRYQDCFYTTN